MFLEDVHTCSKESDEKLQTPMFCAHMFLEGVHMYIPDDTFDLYFICYKSLCIMLCSWFVINLKSYDISYGFNFYLKSLQNIT